MTNTPMKLIIFTRPVIKVLTVLGFVAIFVLVIYLMSGLPAPREENRVGPTNGTFSIIRPPDWEAQVIYSPADRQYATEVNIRPIRSVGREQRIVVSRLRNPPDMEKLKELKYQPGQFQGQPAMILAGKQKYQYLWRAIFERAGSWYDVMIWLTREEDVPHSDWWPYLTSFRAREVPATEPATMPSSIPATFPTFGDVPTGTPSAQK
jgi:hypothetical protein